MQNSPTAGIPFTI